MSNSKWRFQTFKSGYAGDDTAPKPLLPTGAGGNDEEKQKKKVKTNRGAVKPLYPLNTVSNKE